MKVVLVKENNEFRLLKGTNTVNARELALRSRYTNGELKYYELDYDPSFGFPLEGYIVALNQYPSILDKIDNCILKEIK